MKDQAVNFLDLLVLRICRQGILGSPQKFEQQVEIAWSELLTNKMSFQNSKKFDTNSDFQDAA